MSLEIQTISTGYQPHQYQAEIHENMRRFSVLACHRRFGKTILAVNTLINAALTTDEGLFAYVAPYLKQARQIAWDLCIAYSQMIPGMDYNRSEGAVRFPNGSKILLAGSDNDQALRGLGLSGCVADEIADFRPETWPEVIRPALAADGRGRQGWFLAIGTPKGMNQFYDLFAHAQADPEWYAGMFRVDETELEWLSDEELELSKLVMSDAQYRQEWLCDFAASADNVLITIDMVSEACARHKHEMDLEGLPKILGVDVARFGDDRSVIQRRWGLLAYEPMVLENVDNMHLAGVVAQQIERFKPDATFIDGGRGEGVIDRLRQTGHPVIEVQFGARAINPRYGNKRTEMWDLMANWIKEGGALPGLTDLKTDLVSPTYSFDAANRMKLEPKEKMKERGLRSTDLADALACTFAHPVVPHVGTGPQMITDHIDYMEVS